MSDNNTPFSVIVTEGAHDVEAVGKILRLKGFYETKKITEIPDSLQGVIPQKYPLKNGGRELTRIIPHPSFFIKGNYYILVSNANGKTELAKNLKGILSVPHVECIDAAFRGAAILADADDRDAETSRSALYDQLTAVFKDNDDFVLNTFNPISIKLYGTNKPFCVYIFPNDHDSGTLEHVLVDGARTVYPDLLRMAENYVSEAKNVPRAKELNKAFNGEKAVVGVIANALRPGKANQVSVRDNDWFTQASLSSIPSHIALSGFIDTIIGWGAV